MARLAPLPVDDSDPEIKEAFGPKIANKGFVVNSLRIMQRKPKLLKAQLKMSAAVWDPEGEVSVALKRMLAYAASRQQECNYCMAHNALGARERNARTHDAATAVLRPRAERRLMSNPQIPPAQPAAACGIANAPPQRGPPTNFQATM